MFKRAAVKLQAFTAGSQPVKTISIVRKIVRKAIPFSMLLEKTGLQSQNFSLSLKETNFSHTQALYTIVFCCINVCLVNAKKIHKQK